MTGKGISLLGVYIPPDTSPFGQQIDLIYECLISYMYDICDDICLVLGDFNGRIGKKPDVISEIDKTAARTAIDETLNDHG